MNYLELAIELSYTSVNMIIRFSEPNVFASAYFYMKFLNSPAAWSMPVRSVVPPPGLITYNIADKASNSI